MRTLSLFARPKLKRRQPCPRLGSRSLQLKESASELTQGAVAQRASISAGYLRAIEKDAVSRIWSVFLSIVRRLGRPSELFNRTSRQDGIR